jgi:hypothetical protein
VDQVLNILLHCLADVWPLCTVVEASATDSGQTELQHPPVQRLRQRYCNDTREWQQHPPQRMVSPVLSILILQLTIPAFSLG